MTITQACGQILGGGAVCVCPESWRRGCMALRMWGRRGTFRWVPRGLCCDATDSSSDVLKSGNLYMFFEMRVRTPAYLLEYGELGNLPEG